MKNSSTFLKPVLKLVLASVILFSVFSISSYAQVAPVTSAIQEAAPRKYMTARWTGAQDKDASLAHILALIEKETGQKYSAADFIQIENRNMATLHFNMWVQTAGGVVVQNGAIRTWTTLDKNEAIQVEFALAMPEKILRLQNRLKSMGAIARIDAKTKAKIQNLVIQAMHENAERMGTEDTEIHSQKSKTYWSENGELIQEIIIRGRQGTHTIVISVEKLVVVSSKYKSFAKAELSNNTDEFSLNAKIFPISEEAEGDAGNGRYFERELAELKYLKRKVKRVSKDPFTSLRTRQYFEPLYDSAKGDTAEGRAKGYWSFGWINSEIDRLIKELPERDNDFANGVILEGRYSTINIHPNALKLLEKSETPLYYSSRMKVGWRQVSYKGMEFSEMLPLTAIMGRRINSAQEALDRPARRLADHDAATYVDDGFDELQVYYSINRLMDSLHSMGFTDPELSTRPFNAFLYDPDPSMKNNAYYVSDSINFTTYSPKNPNFARDNSTIWHELGHGVMERLMGEFVGLADTGGLSEGMGDFIAALVLADVTNGQPYRGSNVMRIENRTGFHFTNEVHDDGEAYGGAMNDLLKQAMAKWGREGLRKVTELTLQTMRLTRNHPALTAEDWFVHMAFADQLGAPGVRQPGELLSMIIAALKERNFSLNGGEAAKFSVTIDTEKGPKELADPNEGSLENPVKIFTSEGKTVTKVIRVSLKSTAEYAFNYPVRISVQMNGASKQGDIQWVDENKPLEYLLKSDQDIAVINLGVKPTCEPGSTTSGVCSDFVYIHAYDSKSNSLSVAKKRFFALVLPKSNKK